MRKRVLSGMRPTGKLHLGHLHGALGNWLALQEKYECHYFVADWHALTTDFASTDKIKENIREMLLDWLAVGLDPAKSVLFVQSDVKEHAELFLLLSMITPVPWLERNPTYKEQQQEIQDKDLHNLGFLAYPVLQAADILMYQADFVPVGIDQVPHLELTREICRRFNNFYGAVLTEPQALLSDFPRIPGTDGRKMSKSYGNAILLSDTAEEVEAKIRPMVTDPARVRRKDPGDPEKCPVFTLHKVYTPTDERCACATGCTTAAIGCLDCKAVLLRYLARALEPIRERRAGFAAQPGRVDEILRDGAERARAEAHRTMAAVRAAVRI